MAVISMDILGAVLIGLYATLSISIPARAHMAIEIMRDGMKLRMKG